MASTPKFGKYSKVSFANLGLLTKWAVFLCTRLDARDLVNWYIEPYL